MNVFQAKDESGRVLDPVHLTPGGTAELTGGSSITLLGRNYQLD